MLIRSTIIFLGVTFGIAWGMPALYVALVPNAQGALTGLAIVHFVSTFGPAVGGIAAAASCRYGALRRYFSFLTRLAIGWRWYAGTAAVIIAVYLAVELFKYSLGGSPLFGLWNPWLLPLFLVPLAGDQGAIEELGFRGWLLPSMQGTFPPYIAACIVGVCWFLFHYTVLLPGFPFTVHRLPNWNYAAAFFVQITALSYIFTVIFNATGGSVPLVFVAHWLVNVAIKVPAFSGHWVVWPIAIALVAIGVAALGRRNLTNESKVTAP